MALFLDVDGTLLDIAATPQAVRVPDNLRADLGKVARRLDGALALVSGRSIATLDRLFPALGCAAAGQHGAELRLPSGECERLDAMEPLPERILAGIDAIARDLLRSSAPAWRNSGRRNHDSPRPARATMLGRASGDHGIREPRVTNR